MGDKTSEFAGRDDMGLVPKEKAKQTEPQARWFYFKMIFGINTFWAPLLAAVVYTAVSFVFPGQAELYEAKLQFIRKYDLGYLYLAHFLVNLARAYATLNANGARAPARVDRPDQHVYKVMAESGPLSNAPYVMMVTTGDAGRFNRAQRACNNLDESMPLFLTGILLTAAVYGPVAIALALIYMCGVYRFATDYKNGKKARMTGFMLIALTSSINSGFVSITAFLALVRPLLPF